MSMNCKISGQHTFEKIDYTQIKILVVDVSVTYHVHCSLASGRCGINLCDPGYKNAASTDIN